MNWAQTAVAHTVLDVAVVDGELTVLMDDVGDRLVPPDESATGWCRPTTRRSASPSTTPNSTASPDGNILPGLVGFAACPGGSGL